MATLTQYDPLRNTVPLLSAMDRLFQDSFVRPFGWTATPGVPIDVEETADAYVVTASLPGWKPEDVNLTVQDGTLTIAGEYRGAQTGEQGATYQLRERTVGSFSRAITLPLPVDADQAQAGYEHGVLTLTLPKAASARPKVIKIGPGDQKRLAPSSK